MSDKMFVDTNVLIYAHDMDAKAKHEAGKASPARALERTSGCAQHAGASRVFRERHAKNFAPAMQGICPTGREHL